ncbi:hypothetical protein [Hydrocarboniphaga sp.]|uniref:hypothetical protein n=1 Tax=Hydrocarboniphaga sp. TaxID=2033016 RepID=UPI00263689E8|nr:hypothetical protein [Hydrocarboniphaga sp.]
MAAWKRKGLAAALLLTTAPAMAAELTLPPVSIGAGVRTSFTDSSYSGSSVKDSDDFTVDSVRLYLSGAATDTVKFTFNTEYNSSSDSVIVMDAIARFEYSPQFNIWAGRFLPPSDRANLYGPYYANHWGVYRENVLDGYANTAVGRDNGVAYWGDFGGLKVSAGLFDVPGTSSTASPNTNADANKVIAAGRLQYDFWDKESGYWLNSTYYGAKDLLAIGVAGQTAGGDTSFTVDFLLEKNLGGAGVFTIESEYAKYEGLTSVFAEKTTGAYGLVSYLFPQPVGIGKIQLLGKYAESVTDVSGSDPKLKTFEGDIGYIVKEFKVRGYLFYIDQSWDNSPAAVDATYAGVGLQVQI